MTGPPAKNVQFFQITKSYTYIGYIDLQPIRHFDPLLCGFLYVAWLYDLCILLKELRYGPNVKRQIGSLNEQFETAI